ncbi:VanZ family protein [Cellulomonas sp. KRMCY2]|uniref:VanZ family protein n=1 Tax=Cellulomonas sp. KRMCY2 TaxID=1304865 RepID=UPI0009DE7292
MQYFRMIYAAPLFAVALVAGVFAVAGTRWGIARGHERRVAASTAMIAAGMSAAAVITAAITLPSAGAAAPDRYLSLNVLTEIGQQAADAAHSSTAAAQLLINLLLLSWLGALLPLLIPRLKVPSTTAIVVAASLFIESMQYWMNDGRAATLSDVVLNSLGGLASAVVGVNVLRPRLARWREPEGAGEERSVPTSSTQSRSRSSSSHQN